MSIVEKFGPHLPFLRRYARALTGSQQSGDRYIVASLEALASDPSALQPDDDARLALYRFFHVIWNGIGARFSDTSGGTIAVDERLQALAPIHRQAFLLTSLEGFTTADAARVLGVSEPEFGKLERDALREIESQVVTNVLIIEDEPIIAADLESIVVELGHSVCGIAATHSDAVKLARSTTPGLILCDVQLADGSSGIEAVAEILQSFDVPVIFITAFPERLLTGQRPEPTYLIPKPFQEQAVKAAIGQALFFHAPADPANS